MNSFRCETNFFPKKHISDVELDAESNGVENKSISPSPVEISPIYVYVNILSAIYSENSNKIDLTGSD